MTFKRIVRYILTCTNGIWDDELYLKSLFKLSGGQYTLNLSDPKTLNEKFNWNKLHDHNALYHKMVDKYEVKKIVASFIGDEYVVPCYGVWERPEDVDLQSLPGQFVLKATHDSSGVFICKDKQFISKKDITNHFKNWKASHYQAAREWVYKDVRPRIIADKFIDDKSGHELTDYKFWCFNGEPKLMYVTNKGANVTENFYDLDFNPIDIYHGFPRHKPEYKKPAQFELMKSLCVKLLKDIKPSFVRVDFFNVDGRVYFGEFTFYDWGGIQPFANYEMDLRLGELMQL